jgi:hypothetical protein
MFPHEEGQWLDSTASGTQLIFDQYGFDILFFGCTATRSAHYLIIQPDGDTIRCYNIITWDHAGGDCDCIDDFAIDPGSDKLCPVNIHLPCGTDEDEIYPYSPGDVVASEGGATLYFDHYGSDVTVYDCKGHLTAYYYIMHPNGLRTECVQTITWDFPAYGCACIDDFTLDPGSDKLCPKDIHFPCGTEADELFPYSPGDVVASDAGATLYFDHYDFDILVIGCKGSRTAQYYILHANGLTTRCEQKITWDQVSSICPCIDDLSSGGHHSTSGNVPGYDVISDERSIPDLRVVKNEAEPDIDLYRIYPNPVLQDFTLEVKSELKAITDVRVSDVHGKIWFQRSGDVLHDAILQIQSESWPPGIYLVILTTDSEVQTKRLVKQ